MAFYCDVYVAIGIRMSKRKGLSLADYPRWLWVPSSLAAYIFIYHMFACILPAGWKRKYSNDGKLFSAAWS